MSEDTKGDSPDSERKTQHPNDIAITDSPDAPGKADRFITYYSFFFLKYVSLIFNSSSPSTNKTNKHADAPLGRAPPPTQAVILPPLNNNGRQSRIRIGDTRSSKRSGIDRTPLNSTFVEAVSKYLGKDLEHPVDISAIRAGA